MILSSADAPNILNNFKDLTQAGGFLKKLKAEYAQSLQEMNKDPNLQ